MLSLICLISYLFFFFPLNSDSALRTNTNSFILM